METPHPNSRLMSEHLQHLPVEVPFVPEYHTTAYNIALFPVSAYSHSVRDVVHASIWARYCWWLSTDIAECQIPMYFYLDPDIKDEAMETFERHGISEASIKLMPEDDSDQSCRFLVDRDLRHAEWVYYIHPRYYIGRRFSTEIKPRYNFFQRWTHRRIGTPGFYDIKRRRVNSKEFEYIEKEGLARNMGGHQVYNRYQNDLPVWEASPGLVAWPSSKISEMDRVKSEWIRMAARKVPHLGHFLSLYQEIWGKGTDMVTTVALNTFDLPKDIPDDFRGHFFFGGEDGGRGKVAWYKEVGIIQEEIDIRIMEGARAKRVSRARESQEEDLPMQE